MSTKRSASAAQLEPDGPTKRALFVENESEDDPSPDPAQQQKEGTLQLDMKQEVIMEEPLDQDVLGTPTQRPEQRPVFTQEEHHVMDEQQSEPNAPPQVLHNSQEAVGDEPEEAVKETPQPCKLYSIDPDPDRSDRQVHEDAVYKWLYLRPHHMYGALAVPVEPGDEQLGHHGQQVFARRDPHGLCILHGLHLRHADNMLRRVFHFHRVMGKLMWVSGWPLTEEEWQYVKSVLADEGNLPMLMHGKRVLKPLPDAPLPGRLQPCDKDTGALLDGPCISGTEAHEWNKGRQFFTNGSSGFLWADGAYSHGPQALATYREARCWVVPPLAF